MSSPPGTGLEVPTANTRATSTTSTLHDEELPTTSEKVVDDTSSKRDTASEHTVDGTKETTDPEADLAGAELTPEYPTGWKLTMLVVAMALAIFLQALDMTIVATAIPEITNQFKSLDDVGWYGAAFFMTVGAFQSTCKSPITHHICICTDTSRGQGVQVL